MNKLVFDFDFIIFEAVSIAEERFITALHKPSGRRLEFPTKTALWGDWRKKQNGWIGEENTANENEYYKAEDFEVVECQRPRPFKISGQEGRIDEFGLPRKGFVDSYSISPWEGAKRVLDKKIKDICEKLGTNDYYGFTGRGKTFREDIATILEYKGNRKDVLRPLLLDRMKDYVCKRHNCTMVKGIESDDAVAIETLKGYENWKKNGKKDDDKVICIQEDKDGKQTSGWRYNPNKDDVPYLIEGFGKLFLDDKGKVDGGGRIWLLHQVLSGDSSDNYSANSATEKSWGEKASYKLLKDCKNDKEAFEAVIKGYKTLYPEPKTIIGWQGEEIVIDWFYVLQENFSLARMLKYENEPLIDLKDVFAKLGVKYDK